MDEENAFLHSGALFRHKEKQNHVVFRKMDGIRDHHVKQNN
jgi:hypothetical protein